MFRKPYLWSFWPGTPVSQVRVSLSGVAVLMLCFGFVAVVVIAVKSPIPCIPDPEEATAILGTLLTAQAAITALSLAVTLFMMQGISSRADVDDRMYREYVRRSRIRGFFWGSLAAVVATSILLLSEGFVTGLGASVEPMRESGNFVLSATIAFLLNMILTGVLFERAIHLSRPDRWAAMRRDLTRADVREAVGAFVHRRRRAHDAEFNGEAEATVLFPDQAEGSADEAVRALLDDARRAMAERRHGEFERSLDALAALVEYAMDEIKGAGIGWGAPGAQPAWPPLYELSRYLYSFREDVIRSGDRERVFQLLDFDHRLTSAGLRGRCGELFSVGLNGYRWNYQIATRIGAVEFQETLRDQLFQTADILDFGSEPVVDASYARETVRQQERLLSDAMDSDHPRDFAQLDRGFRAWLDGIRLQWSVEDWSSPRAFELYEELEQLYRIVLMGLGGRALLQAQSDKMGDITPFLNVARQSNRDLGKLTEDLVNALSWSDDRSIFLWRDWETEDAMPNQTFSILPQRYPLLLYTLRLLELSSETMTSVDLRGRSKQVLDWFTNHAESIESYVRADLDLPFQQRREFAEEALKAAVRSDDVAHDFEIIGRELSAGRVSTFTSEVYGAAFSSNSVEQLFERADARLHLPGDAVDAPTERTIYRWGHKGSFTETPDGALIGFGEVNGHQFGRALSNDALRRFCETLDGAIELVVSVDTPAELLQGMDQAIDDLTGRKHLAVVLVGDWSHIQVGLMTENPEGYEAAWKLPEADRVGETGRYRGYPILSARDDEDRCVYVVDLAAWGQFVRARTDEDHDLRVEIKPISIGRAKELLASNPEHFHSEPDEESKLRKLQTRVEIVIGARTGFRVADPARARRISPIRQMEESGEVARG